VISKKRGGRRNLAARGGGKVGCWEKIPSTVTGADGLVERYLTDLKPFSISSKNR